MPFKVIGPLIKFANCKIVIKTGIWYMSFYEKKEKFYSMVHQAVRSTL